MYALLLLFSFALSRVLVYSPELLKTHFEQIYSNGEIPSSLGNFGNPPYGTSLVGRVYYPEKIDERDGCKPLTPIKFASDPEIPSTPILLLDRGECYFVIKTRHAEDIGASLVLIANNLDNDVATIIMTDNGRGGNLQIPTVLISKIDANTIKNYLNDPTYKTHVSLSVSFDIKKNSNKISYSLWTSPTLENSRYFLMHFAEFGTKLDKSVALFVPHYILWYCPTCQETNYDVDNPNCVSGGRYCWIDPDGEGPLTGRDVMMEDLRQICLYKETSYRNDYKLWFDYHKEYYIGCNQNLFEIECSKNVFETIGFSYNKIEKCVKDSFEGDNEALADNKYLRKEASDWNEIRIAFYPSIIINDQLYRGDLEVDAVLDGLCAGYSFGTEPQICKDLHPPNQQENERNKTSSVLIILFCIVCIVLVIGILIVYKMIVKKDLSSDMKVQVNNAVSQYFQLAENPRQ
jgi:PA domain